MRILKASLCYRFYLSDGWVRSAVEELLLGGGIEFVIPRWYDCERDAELNSKMSAPADYDCTGADYFAVYNTSIKFDEKKLLEHKIEYPEIGLLRSGEKNF